jgi:hypothetical protein
MLATLDSAEKNSEAVSLIGGVSTWIGANDRQGEGLWAWPSGGTLPPAHSPTSTYANWRSGEPSGARYGDEDCACFNCSPLQPNGEWNDANCAHAYAFLCQDLAPPSPRPPPSPPPPPAPPSPPPLPAAPPLTELACGSTVTGSTVGMPNIFGQGGHGAGDAPYHFCSSVEGYYTFSTCGSSFDTWLRVMSADLTREVTSCDDCGSCGSQTILTHWLQANACYVVVVDGFAHEEGIYVLTAECPEAPPGVAVPQPPPSPPTGTYTVVSTPLSWGDAKAHCEQRGGTLASAHDARDMRELEDVLRAATPPPPPPPCAENYADCEASSCCKNPRYGCYTRVHHSMRWLPPAQCRPLRQPCHSSRVWTCPTDAAQPPTPLAPPPPSPPPPPPVPAKDDRSCILTFATVGSNGECGYPPLLKVIFSDERLDGFSYSFFRPGDYAIDPTLAADSDCQAHCRHTRGCAAFFYQYETTRLTGTDSVHKCMIYSSYPLSSHRSCKVFYPDNVGRLDGRLAAAGPPTCHQQFLPDVGGHVEAWIGGRLVAKNWEDGDLAYRAWTWAVAGDHTFPPSLVLSQPFSQWAPGEPAIDETFGSWRLPADGCMVVGADGLWARRGCQLARPFVCQALSVTLPPLMLPSPPPPTPSLPPIAPPPPHPPPPPRAPFRGFTFFNDHKTWPEARALCTGRGGTLAKVASAAQMAEVAALSSEAPLGEGAWLGATDVDQEGTWRWLVDGSLVPPTPDAAPDAYSNWSPGEPTGMKYGDEDCLCMSCDPPDTWNDVPCGLKKAFVCMDLAYTPPAPPLAPSPPALPPLTEVTCSSVLTGQLGPHATGGGGASQPALFTFKAAFAGSYTFSTCGSSYATFVRLYDQRTGRQVTSCDGCGPCDGRAIIHHHLVKDTWYRLSIEQSNSRGPPSPVGIFVLRTYCPDSPPLPPTPPSPPSPPPDLRSSPPPPPLPPPSPGTPPVWGFSFHRTKLSWADALHACEAHGGTLAKVDSDVADGQIHELDSSSVPTWIGANDLAVEGVWRWSADNSQLPPSNGADSTAYANWGPGEPSAMKWGNEDCACFNCDGLRRTTWNDADCGEKKAYVCQGIAPPSAPPPPPHPSPKPSPPPSPSPTPPPSQPPPVPPSLPPPTAPLPHPASAVVPTLLVGLGGGLGVFLFCRYRRRRPMARKRLLDEQAITSTSGAGDYVAPLASITPMGGGRTETGSVAAVEEGQNLPAALPQPASEAQVGSGSASSAEEGAGSSSGLEPLGVEPLSVEPLQMAAVSPHKKYSERIARARNANVSTGRTSLGSAGGTRAGGEERTTPSVSDSPAPPLPHLVLPATADELNMEL